MKSKYFKTPNSIMLADEEKQCKPLPVQLDPLDQDCHDQNQNMIDEKETNQKFLETNKKATAEQQDPEVKVEKVKRRGRPKRGRKLPTQNYDMLGVRGLFKSSNKLLKFYNQFINDFKQTQMTKPFWQQMLDYRCYKKQQRKHDFMKHLSYQTFNVMQNQGSLLVDTIASRIILKNSDFAVDQDNKNIKKRVYDILNTLNVVGFLTKNQHQNKTGKWMKKNRKYSINPDCYDRACVKNIHLERIIQVIEARKAYKKKMLQTQKKMLQSVRLGRKKIMQRSERSRLNGESLRGQIVAFYCPIQIDNNGNHIPSDLVSFSFPNNRRTFSIKSKLIDQNSIFLRTELLTKLYAVQHKKRGRKSKAQKNAMFHSMSVKQEKPQEDS